MKWNKMTGWMTVLVSVMLLGLEPPPARAVNPVNVSFTVKGLPTLALLANYDPLSPGAAAALMIWDKYANGMWIYDATSSATTNTYNCIKPTWRTGRWLRLSMPVNFTGTNTYIESLSVSNLVSTNTTLLGGGITATASAGILNGTFASDTNWTASTAAWTIHDGKAYMVADGSARTLSQAVTGMAANKVYVLGFDLATSGGSLSVTLGGWTYRTAFTGTASKLAYFLTGGTGDLIFTGATDFTGTIDNVVLTELTGADVNTTFADVNGNVIVEFRTGKTNAVYLGKNAGKYVSAVGQGNTVIGDSAGEYNIVGTLNSYGGYQAGIKNLEGTGNAFWGAYSGRYLRYGSYNSFLGNYAGAGLDNGSYNDFSGYHSGYAATNSNYNTFGGARSGESITTGGTNLFLGATAGYNASQLATANNSAGLGPGAYTTQDYQFVISTNFTEVMLPGNVIMPYGFITNLVLEGTTAKSIVPATNAVDNLGSSSKFFLQSYAATVNATNIVLGARTIAWKTNTIILPYWDATGHVTNATTNVIVYLGY